MKVIIEMRPGFQVPTYPPQQHQRIVGEWEELSPLVAVPWNGAPPERFAGTDACLVPLSSCRILGRVKAQE